MMKPRSHLAIDLAIWFAAPLIFLGIYILRFHHPLAVLPEHLYPVALLAALALLLRLSMLRLLPWRSAALLLSSMFNVSIMMFLLAYYFLVLTGLASWGKVVSRELIVSYAGQAEGLCEAIGWSYPVVLGGLFVAWVLMVAAYFAFVRRSALAIMPGAPPRIRRLVTLMLSLSVLLVLHRFDASLSERHAGSSEPFALTLYGGQDRPNTDDHSVLHYAQFDRQESDARDKYRPAKDARRKNVILIVADGLRADHTQPYGYARATTPYLQAAVQEGSLEKFDNVHSPCSESNCAMASLLSSRDPDRYPTNAITLAQVLKLHGYVTRMILSGDQTNYYNKRAIYGDVDSYFDGSMAGKQYASDDNLVLDKTKELPAWKGAPTMIQFHLMSVHLLGRKFETYRAFTPAASFAPRTRGMPEARFTNQYDNGVLQFDAFVHQILAVLRDKKYLDDAIVVITSDHGDSLGERGLLSHANGVHEPVLHIPLWISGLKPRATGSEKPFISLTDIGPTILDELGAPIPASWSGVPIPQLQATERNAGLVPVRMHEFAGVFDGRHAGARWKYWIDGTTKEEFVYDLAKDPSEQTNLLWKAPRSLLDEWRAAAPAK
jgi:glucan phosphoethanolaminetransferase (alkaline phosphatase superfamily)